MGGRGGLGGTETGIEGYDYYTDKGGTRHPIDPLSVEVINGDGDAEIVIKTKPTVGLPVMRRFVIRKPKEDK